ncbi:RNA-guided endonuclease InsQ/TnpB family protein [Microvirga massiliensis]|uniref:RNA-guided endonuclease InsQ/TnpB family protein n=1 Tax=Microvirga massiliensis TaxID=1033741 RepID=UPI00062BB671|nr:RNA-guided endonuclease TnpB family protein [Microvirga massiliensis]
MPLVHRRVTYKLYPSSRQAAMLERVCDLHRALYNAALEERIEAYRKAGQSISFADQCRSLTQIRAEDPAYLAINAQSAQVTLKRLDRAFQNFFRRVKAGQTPGFPRFKSRDRFPGFGFKSHGDGFRFTPGQGWRHGTLHLSGISAMRARGEARTPGEVVCADLQRTADGWFLSLVVACEPHRERTGDRIGGLDWGVETYATLCHGPFAFEEVENDRFLAAEQDALREEQRALSRALRGKRSKRTARARRLLARRARRLANRRKNRTHQVTARLVREHALIVTEDLAIQNMTASARGDAVKPGTNVRQKAGLNRAILDTAPGSFLSNLRIKAEEAGSQIMLIDPRQHKPSQTCPIFGMVRKKGLSERTHALPDGRVITRDQASAWVLWNIGQELAAAKRPETVVRAAQAA